MCDVVAIRTYMVRWWRSPFHWSSTGLASSVHSTGTATWAWVKRVQGTTSLPEGLPGAQGKIPVILDGGIRRGTNVFTALALGAVAVGIGRPYIRCLARSVRRASGWSWRSCVARRSWCWHNAGRPPSPAHTSSSGRRPTVVHHTARCDGRREGRGQFPGRGGRGSAVGGRMPFSRM